MGIRSVALVLLSLLALVRSASGIEDLDQTRAQARFEHGRALYLANDFRGAAREFEAARELKPHPAFDYNLARCYDRLDQIGAAISAYDRYLASNPSDPDTPEVRKRLAVLRGRRAASRAIWAPAAVGGLALASGVVGAALLGTAPARYDVLVSQQCAPRCDTRSVDSARAMDYAGKALLGLGGALFVVDIALWATHKRRVASLRHGGDSVVP